MYFGSTYGNLLEAAPLTPAAGETPYSPGELQP